jgi:hypothetical protein
MKLAYVSMFSTNSKLAKPETVRARIAKALQPTAFHSGTSLGQQLMT